MDGDGDGCCGDGDDVERSCSDRGGDDSCGDGQGWVQISVPMQLSSAVHTNSNHPQRAAESSLTAYADAVCLSLQPFTCNHIYTEKYT